MKALGDFIRLVAVRLGLSLALGAACAALLPVVAAHAAVVSSIDVRGNQRVEDGTIINYVGIRPNVPFDNEDIDEGVKRLFSTGLFSDVRINVAGRILVISVQEYALINEVIFQGNRKQKDNALANVVQLKPGGTFSQAALELDEQAIRESYERLGRSEATVTSQVVELGENRVNVVFNINEGGRTKIAQINFVGNSAFSDRRLASVIATKKSNLLSFLGRSDVYDEDRMRADEEALRRFYYNRGYADFRIVSSTATLDETTNEYTITITVEEGERYRFGAIEIDSAVADIDPQSLRHLVETKEGAVYSAEAVEKSLVALSEALAEHGYVFAEVTPRGDRDFDSRTISVVYSIDQGSRTYIQRIEIRGNSRTRDYVIRREFDISEGDAFNQALVQRAKKRLENLDYFTSVNVATIPGDQPDQVILVVDVVEKATGEFSVGGGYATGGETPGPTAEFSITEKNFLGRGQYIRLALGGGKDSRNYQLSFTEPYFLGRRIAAGFDLFKQKRTNRSYDYDVQGATIRFGLPITEALVTQIAYNFTEQRYAYGDWNLHGPSGMPYCPNPYGITDPTQPIDPVTNPLRCPLPRAIQTAIANSPWMKSSVSASFTYNTIDNMRDPREGLYLTGALEYAGLGGDANFLRATARGSYYHMLVDSLDVVGILSAGAGHVYSIGNNGLSTFDLFQANSRIVRGFENTGFGPAVVFSGPGGTLTEHIGGTTYFHASAETQFPMPVIPESIGIRGALFADVGTLYGYPSSLMLDPTENIVSTGLNLRASVGIGLIWNSPFGPLRIDYAVPVMKEASDKVQEFNFGITGRF